MTDVATAEAVVALDEATLAARRRAQPMDAAYREPAILGIDLGTTEVKAGLVGLDGRLLGLARSGYALDVGRPRLGGAGPGGLVVRRGQRGARAATSDVAEVVAIGVDGHGPTLVSVDARGEATRPGDHVPRHALAAEADELAAATGVRGWASGRPAGRALGRAPRARRRRGDLLVPRDLGVARVPADRGRRRPARPGPDRRRIAALVAGGRGPDRPPAAADRDRAPRRWTDRDGRRCARLLPGIPVAGGTVDAFASYLGAGLLEPATPTTRAGRPAGSASTGTGPSMSRADS